MENKVKFYPILYENNKLYVHINKINGKKYFGITCLNLKRRWKKGNAYKKCSYFYNAIQKYGWDNFEHIQIIDHLTRWNACCFEKFFIMFYRTNNSNFGYNCTSGGENNYYIQNKKNRKGFIPANAKKVICLETKEIFDSATHASKKYNLNHSLISTCCREERYTCGGFHWLFYSKYLNKTKEEINKIIAIKRNKKVVCLETLIMYNSTIEVEQKTNIDRSSVIRCCKNKQITAGKYHFMYYSEYIQLTPEQIQEKLNK